MDAFSQKVWKWFCASFEGWKCVKMVQTWLYSECKLLRIVFGSFEKFWAPIWPKKAQKGRKKKLLKFDFYWLESNSGHPREHSAWFLDRNTLFSVREGCFHFWKTACKKVETFSQKMWKWICASFEGWKCVKMVQTCLYSEYELLRFDFGSFEKFWGPIWPKKAEK